LVRGLGHPVGGQDGDAERPLHRPRCGLPNHVSTQRNSGARTRWAGFTRSHLALAQTTRSRVSVLLANAEQQRTLTITHVLWAMFGLLPPDQEQRPHRHQSVALDLILDAQPGCYTLLGTRLDERGDIVNPTRVDWEAGGAFVTPPGLWHAHFNESGAPAHLIPVQDAGLQTYLRSLDIRFSDRR